MTASVRVSTERATYDVLIGEGIIDGLGSAFSSVSRSRRAAIVTDATVDRLMGDRAEASLRQAGVAALRIAVPAGESSKSWSQAGLVLERLADARLDRSDTLVALGGGVIGDLAGFCSAVYLRGIAVVQVPTTLLAQVDASVGGKTAVDLQAGKNLVGAFIQPKIVVADTAVLSTLSDTEWMSGLGEVAKSAVLDGEESLGWLEAHATRLAAREPGIVAEAVRRAVSFKARVVHDDEFDLGVRESLNLGHTLGHALEAAGGYGSIAHGLAVAEGMRFAARLATRVADSQSGFTERQEALLAALGLPVLSGTWDANAVRSFMSSDKKARAGRVRFVLATSPGHHVVMPVDEKMLAEELSAWARDRGKGEPTA